jgi:hypothetical protein
MLCSWLSKAAQRRQIIATAEGAVVHCKSRWCVSDPLARFARVSPSRGETNFILPLREGESRRRRQGVDHTHLELELNNTPLQSRLTSSIFPAAQSCSAFAPVAARRGTRLRHTSSVCVPVNPSHPASRPCRPAVVPFCRIHDSLLHASR